MRDSLSHADEHAAEECPFWLKPEPDFDGFQTDTNRIVLLGESMGGLALIYQDRVLLGGGGALRLLLGYGVTDRLTIAGGLEVGGAGGVSGIGDDEQALVARPTAAIPLVFRVHDDTWLYDFEVAALSLYHDRAVLLPPGLRGAFGLGIGSVRIGAIMPVIMGFVGYEHHPEFRDLPMSHALRVGTRIGVNYDP
jgi:hypothetical protein